MHVKEGNIALDLRRAERVWSTTVFVQVFSSATEHTLAQICAPLFSMPIPFAPLALCGELLIGPVPWTIDGFDHAGDMPRRIRGRLRRKMVNDVAMNSPICVGVGKGVGRDHEVSLHVVQSVSQGRDSHSDVSCLVGEPAVSLDFRRERDVIFLL